MRLNTNEGDVTRGHGWLCSHTRLVQILGPPFLSIARYFTPFNSLDSLVQCAETAPTSEAAGAQ